MGLSFKKNKGWIWIGLGGMALVFRMILANHPALIEEYYSRHLFLLIRRLLDALVGWLPFPLFLPLLGLVFLILLLRGIRFWRQKMPWPQRLGRFTLSLFSFLGALIFWFLLLWGFNYGRIPIEQQLDLDPQAMDSLALHQALLVETTLLTQNRAQIPEADTSALNSQHLPANLETQIRQLVERQLHRLGYPAGSSLRARTLRPKGVLLRISTAGFYLPFTGECNLDAGLHPIQIPFVMAHEFAHGYGITDEGACNFIAYLACKESSNAFIRYAAHYGYWRYLRSGFYRVDPDAYERYRDQLPAGLIADARAVRKNSNQYPDIFPKIRNLTYDTYLKAQGVQEGLKSYNRVLLLVEAWRRAREMGTTN